MTEPSPGPLAGLRVVDFSRLLPGPYASLILADMGADVIKVEAPRGGDYMRWSPPMVGAWSAGFACLNQGKRSVGLDLKRPEGVAAARALIGSADVVLESFRPGVLERLGLGYEALSAANPALVYCAISGYGQDGPLVERGGHDINYQALAGVLAITAAAEGPGPAPGAQLADIAGGAMWAVMGILGALHARTTTGCGRLVDISMTDGVMSFAHLALGGFLGGHTPAPQPGGEVLTGGQACYGTYETSDGGYMSLGALEPKFWKSFCTAIERPDLLSRSLGGPAQAADTRQQIAEVFKTRTRAEWTEVFAQHDACCEPVLEPSELATHPLHVARGNIVEDTMGYPRLRTPLMPRGHVPEPPPLLGEHTRSILAELGWSAERIDALITSGAGASP